MSIWMTKFTWRTCKRHEADVIRDYFFEQSHAEYHTELERERESWAIAERERERYEHARDLADRHASNFADRHFGRMR
jgi:hypothetical protein